MDLLNPSIAIMKFQLFKFAIAYVQGSQVIIAILLFYIFLLYHLISNNMRNYLFYTKVFRFTQTKQWVQSNEAILKKVKQLALMIKNAKHPIVFTGAGCSTSIGIPDYRSGQNTVVPTGPGIWNRPKQQIAPKVKIDKIVDEAIPSFTHMAIKKLLQKDIIKYLVSQNTDGLHIKSGVPFNRISQLHGNRNVQKCVECNRKYFRDYRTIKRDKPENVINHETGRNCQNCGGKLIDSIVYFGEKLPITDLTNALQHSARCDFLLCIGSSLTVKPSSNVPILALKNKAKLSIINIQQTPFDEYCDLKINGFCDPVMEQFMKQLNIETDIFKFQHFVQIQLKERKLLIQGKDKENNKYTYIKSVKCQNKEYQQKNSIVQIPFQNKQDIHEVQLQFYGTKPSFTLYLPSYYKLFHGQKILLRIQKKYNEANWKVYQCQIRI